jgi:hypothetical protein
MNKTGLFILIAIIGFAGQYIDGSLGMGYGTFLASSMLAIGLMPAMVSASVHIAEIFTSCVSGISHIRLRNVRKDLVIMLIIPGSVGGFFGTYLLCMLPGRFATPWIALVLLILGVWIFIKFLRIKILPREEKLPRKFVVPLGFIAAFCDACAGGGWGPIATPALLLTNKSTPQKIIGSVDTAESIITFVIAVSFFFFLGVKNLNWDLIICLLVGGIAAAPLAALTVKKIPGKLLGIMVGIILISINAKTIIGFLL